MPNGHFDPNKDHVFGSELNATDQAYVLGTFVHRYTKENIPAWAKQKRRNGKLYRPQFTTDAEWLAHTMFNVLASGRIDRNRYSCMATPTWPDGTGDE